MLSMILLELRIVYFRLDRYLELMIIFGELFKFN